MKRPDAGALLLLIAMPLLLLAPFLLGFKVLYFRDIALVFEPQIAFVNASIWSGQLPLWNPLLAGGFPQWASMEPPPIYPFTALYFYLPYPFALALLLWLHLALAATGTYALCRELGWQRPAALVAALSFGMGGFLVSLNSFYTSLQAAALLPLVQLSFHRLCRRPGGLAWLAAGTALALQVAADRPDYTLMILAFLVSYGWHLGRDLPGGRLRPPARLLGLAAVALLVNAAVILPAAEFIRQSQRLEGLNLSEAHLFSLPPAALWQVLVPQFFGDPQWHTDWGRFFTGDPHMEYSQLYPTLYLGMGACLAAGYALLRVRRELALLLGGWAVFGLWMALGTWGGLFGWLHRLPLLWLIRYPAKFLLLWAWSLALLAGIGCDAWLRDPATARRFFRACLAGAAGLLVVVLALMAGAAAWTPRLAGVDWSRFAAGPLDAGQIAFVNDVVPRSLPGALAECLAPLLVLALLAACGMKAGRSPLLRLAFVLIVAADLYGQARPWLYAADPDLYRERSALVAHLRSADRPGGDRLAQVVEPPRRDLVKFLGWAPGQPGSWMEAGARWLRRLLGALSMMDYGLAGTQESPSSLTPRSSIAYLLQAAEQDFPASRHGPQQLRLAGLMNVRYVEMVAVAHAGQPAEAPDAALSQALLRPIWQNRRDAVWLYENTAWRPRAVFSTDAQVVPDVPAAYRWLTGPAAQATSRVVLLGDDALQQTLVVRAAHQGNVPSALPYCRVLAYRNQLVELAVASPTPGYLVLSDNYYPGWRVEVDGEVRPLLQANAVVRAVWVEAGRHVVSFRYLPASWIMGLALSLATLTAMGLALARLVRGRP